MKTNKNKTSEQIKLALAKDLAEQILALNPQVPEIGPGFMANLQDLAKRILTTESCTTGRGALFPEIPPCQSPVIGYLFGEPYCEACTMKLVEMHAKLNQ